MKSLRSQENHDALRKVAPPAALVVASLFLYWLITAIVLWWAYDIGSLIRDGYYQRNQALSAVSKMGIIVTLLTSIIWFVAKRRKTLDARWTLAWNVAWQTSLLLCAYVLIILVKIQFRTDKGALDDSSFLPIVGHTNAQFLSESRSLSFVLHVVPVMGCVSGILYYLLVQLTRLVRSYSHPLS